MTGAAVVWAAVALLYAFVGWYGQPLRALSAVPAAVGGAGGGPAAERAGRRGRLGGWLVRLIMLGAVLDALAFWYMRITFANK